MPLLGPGEEAEEFRRRAGLSSRDAKRCARVHLERATDKIFLTLSRALLATFVCSRSGGEASLEGCSHDSTRCETFFGVSELFEDVKCVPSGWSFVAWSLPNHETLHTQ